MEKTMKFKALAFCGLLLASAAYATDPVVGPQIRTDANGGTAAANETSAASVDPLGNEIVGTYNDWRASGSQEIIRMGVSVSNDGGLSWTDFLVRPPAQNQSGVEGDPMTAYDQRTGTLWVGAISFASNGGIYVARKDPGQNTFQPSVMARRSGGADKCWMAAGPAPGDPNATRLYVTYNEGCIRSTDMGQTWSTPVSIGSGIGFNPKVAPNGNVYVTYWDFNTGVMFRKSTNGGVSFGPEIRVATRMDTWGVNDGSRGPGNFRKPPMNSLAVDPNTGDIYIIYTDTTNIVNGNRNLDLYMVKSTDEGAHWTTPRVINSDANPPGDQFFQWLEVDYKGRLHLTWFDSRNTVQNDNVTNGMYDNYYGYSDDGGQTWADARLTPSPWNSNNDGLNRSQQFLGDYNALAFGGNRAYPYYLSTQNGDPDMFTNVIIDPDVVPVSFQVVLGTGTGNRTTLFKSDNNRLIIENPQAWSSLGDAVSVIFNGTAPVSAPSSFTYTIESGANPGFIHTVELWNWNTSAWDVIATDSTQATDEVITRDKTATSANYIQAGTRAVRSRSRWRPNGAPAIPKLTVRIDHVVWTVMP